jgi:hypothetical protein
MNDKLLSTAKAWAALVGAVVTALLGTVGPDTTYGKVLTAVAAVATAIAVFSVPNTSRDEDGAVSLLEALGIAALAVLALLLFLRLR